MKEKLLNIKKALNLADILLTEYCQIFDVYVEKQETIDQETDEETKEEMQTIKDMDDTIRLALKNVEEMSKEYTTIKISNEIFKKGYKVGVEINGEYYEIKESKKEINF